MSDYLLTPVSFMDVRLADGFWAQRLEINRTVTIPHVIRMCEETGRIDNFAAAGGIRAGRFRGYFFNDSDVYKIVEAAACALAEPHDSTLTAQVDDIIALIAAAQEHDGYLYTARTLCGPDYMPPGGRERWSDLATGHELYCAGHLYEAAAAHVEATGRRTLLDVAIKNADLVCREFGPGRRTAPDGHPEVEIGLVRLYRTTGDRKYLDAARFFVESRGRPDGRTLYGEYAQDHRPLIEQTEAVGHAVRAAYLYAGASDVAALCDDGRYRQPLEALWANVVERKMYLTGGIGSRRDGESFGADHELPNSTAYCETCAAIANALWSHRMFLASGDGRYIDVVERVIYNAFLSGVSLAGGRFFYPNPLASDGAERSAWFDCACCPTNVARFMPRIPGMMYAQRDRQIWVALFAAGQACIRLGGDRVVLRQTTRYPWDGHVQIAVEPEAQAERFTLHVRVPGWARDQPTPGRLYRYADEPGADAEVRVNGQRTDADMEKGFTTIDRVWRPGDLVDIALPMPVRRIVTDERVADNIGKVALERGPIVYCTEDADLHGCRIDDIALSDDEPLQGEHRDDLLGGVTTLHGEAIAGGRQARLTCIPYFAWADRGRTPMAVWLARQGRERHSRMVTV